MLYGHYMNAQALLQEINANELTYEASALIAWELGFVSNAEDVAEFMYRGGPFPPQASAKPPQSLEDRRPDKKYWQFVKQEMHTFLCMDDERYRELWKQIDALQNKTTTTLVGVIAAFLGASLGAPATLVAGFVAVCLYAAVKLGKEAFCSYIAHNRA